MTDKLIERIKADRDAWWRPVKTDEQWLARLRIDYPDNTNLCDDGLRDYYDGHQEFATTWDHIGDAYAEYEPLARRFFDMEARILADAKIIKAARDLYFATEFLEDNDPDDIVADGGITAIMVGLGSIRTAIAAYRAAVSERDG